MKTEEVKVFILNKLEKELSPLLEYHHVEHTLNVYEAVKLICEGEKVNEKQVNLLLVAALFHDSGFLTQREGHEEISCKIARQDLPKFEFNTSDIEFICSAIMATELKHMPKNIYEQIIKDADLDYLGTENYDKISEQLFCELKNYQLIADDRKEWVRLQINFLKSHEYFTATSKKLRNTTKQKTLNLLLSLL